MTDDLFRADAYLKSCGATVTVLCDAGIVLDRTVFYAAGGGQPGDTGVLRTGDGRAVRIVDCVKDRETGAHVHVPVDGEAALFPGDVVTAEIDWERRHRLMRMHTCLHLLCALVLGAVTGGSTSTRRRRWTRSGCRRLSTR